MASLPVAKYQDDTNPVVQNKSVQQDTHSILFDYNRFPSCKRLIHRILEAQKAADMKSIVVLSQFHDDGKTVFIASLALGYMSLLDKKVLIIDTACSADEESFYFHGIAAHPDMDFEGSEYNQGCVGCGYHKEFQPKKYRTRKRFERVTVVFKQLASDAPETQF